MTEPHGLTGKTKLVAVDALSRLEDGDHCREPQSAEVLARHGERAILELDRVVLTDDTITSDDHGVFALHGHGCDVDNGLSRDAGQGCGDGADHADEGSI
jgi:hypothetical protein